MNGYWRWMVVGIVLLACAPGPAVAQSTGVRSGTWTQSGSKDWAAGTLTNLELDPSGDLKFELPGSGFGNVGSYVTAEGEADFLFTHLVARWEAEVPDGAALIVEIRAQPRTGDWTPWMSLFDPQESDSDGGPLNRLEANTGIFGENLVALRDGEKMQARFTFVSAHPQVSPVLHSVDLIYMDASAGPTASKAASEARTLAPHSVGSVPPPAVISRAAWGANEAWMDWPPAYSLVNKIVVHHTVTENDEPDPAATVRAIYYYHAVVRGWGDIGYNYLVDRFGNVYEGRAGGLDVVGGHAYGYNVGSLGIGSLGTFGNTGGSTAPTQAMLDAISTLSAWTASRRLFHPALSSQFYDRYTRNITGHRDYGTTACPGDYMVGDLSALRDATWQRILSYHPGYFTRWGEHGTPVHMTPGSTRTVSIAVKNAGTLVWPSGGSNQVRLGYHWSDQAGNPVILPPTADHRAALSADMGFAAEARWANALLTAPDIPGTYTLRWDMVHEGVTWFADQGSAPLSVSIVVSELPERAFLPTLYIDHLIAGPVPPPPPTPTPEPSPTPPNCMQLLVNGGFENDDGWTLNDTPADAHYTTDPVYAGARALRVGISAGGANLYSYSSADQTVVVPSSGSQVTLSFWRYSLADDDAGDFHYVMVRDGDGNWHTLLSDHDNDGSWLFTEMDLSAYAGQTVTLRYGAFNDGTRGVTSMTVDQVELISCP